MKSFQHLVNEEKVDTLLKSSHKYLAHTPDEVLSDHMELVTHYFLRLMDTHGLEPLIDKQLLKLSGQSETIADFGKKLFWNAILYHDFGKVNENFQQKLENTVHFPERVRNGIEGQHSILSAFIFLIHQITDGMMQLKKESQEKQQKVISFLFALAHNILRHHSPRLDDLSSLQSFEKLNTQLCLQLEAYLKCYNKEVAPQIIRGLKGLMKVNVKFEQLDFEWFALIRLNFSLLTAVDYYATSHYCGKWTKYYEEFGVLSFAQRNTHFNNLKTTKAHNTHLYKNEASILTESLHDLQGKSNKTLNKLRSRMAVEVLYNVRIRANEKLFYIEAPTGGGKTNMAFIATQELLQANTELNKVFYVFPFTTLVSQTQQSAVEIFGLEPDEWIELHGRAAWKQKEGKEADKDGLYGQERLDDIHNQFVNYPYTFLSHVRFFDILKANDKSSIYLMHRLANSIVVIDEVQSYNPELWDKMAFLITEYAESLNIRFVVMSATLPKIGSLAKANFCSLLPNAIDRFFVNANFADRVKFSQELLLKKRPVKEDRQTYLVWLVEQVYQRSEAYRNKYGNVRIIVEFIFKKSATEFSSLAEDLFYDYEIRLLSGTILEPRRKEIIHELKNEDNTLKNILLITTQVVEAGVDIDMDLGFKNRSIIDSEEQLAGRVNRNVNKKDCVVYLFDLDDASVIYGKDRRYKEIGNSLEQEYFNILKTKQFDRLYDKVKDWLEKTNKENGLAGTGKDYKEKQFGQLNFPNIDKEFTLIHHSNISVFVPLCLPLMNSSNSVFSHQQISFLASLEVYPIDGKISGEDVFNLYKRLITNRENSFSDRTRNLKFLQSIMSLYTFSLFADSKVVKELNLGGNQEEYGFLYLVRHKEVYDYNWGLQDNKFNEMIFL